MQSLSACTRVHCSFTFHRYYSDNLKEDEIGRASNTQGNNGNGSKMLVPNYERNRPLRRRRHVREDNIKKNFKGAGYKNVS